MSFDTMTMAKPYSAQELRMCAVERRFDGSPGFCAYDVSAALGVSRQVASRLLREMYSESRLVDLGVVPGEGVRVFALPS